MANDDQRLVGIGRDADGDWYEVVAGTRDSAAQAGDAMSLWVLDPIKVFTARRPAGYNSFGLGDPVGDMLIAMQVKSQGRKAGASLMECVRQQREQLMEGPVEDLLPALEAGESSGPGGLCRGCATTVDQEAGVCGAHRYQEHGWWGAEPGEHAGAWRHAQYGRERHAGHLTGHCSQE